MAVGFEDVPVFQLGGGRQHIVGIVGGVGLELLQHHGEEIVTAQTGQHGSLIGRDRGRVAVVDDQRLDRRAGFLRRGNGIDRARVVVGLGQVGRVQAQRIAQTVHVDGARAAAGQQIGALQTAEIQVAEGAAGAQLDAAAMVAPGADQRRQAGDGAHGHAAAPVTLHAVVDADGRRPRGGVVAGQRRRCVRPECR